VALLFLSMLLQYGVTCRVTTSHEDEEEPCEVERVVAEETILPGEGIYLDERITIELDRPVDPDSVTPETVRIRRADTGEPADGAFHVEGRAIVFVPRPPSRADLSDSGLAPGIRYRIHLPAGRGRAHESVHAKDGSTLASGFSVRFETRRDAPFFRDAVPGPPRAEAIFVDADGDGAVDGWAQVPVHPERGDSARETLFVEAVPRVESVGDGQAYEPVRVALLFSEALDPRGVEEGEALELQLLPRGRAARTVPARRTEGRTPCVRLASQYDPSCARFRSLAIVEIPGPTPSEGLVRLTAFRRLLDLAGEPLERELRATVRLRAP
jgi:hypothetical protein